MGVIATSAGLLRIAVPLAAALVVLVAAFAGLLGVAIGSDACASDTPTATSAKRSSATTTRTRTSTTCWSAPAPTRATSPWPLAAAQAGSTHPPARQTSAPPAASPRRPHSNAGTAPRSTSSRGRHHTARVGRLRRPARAGPRLEPVRGVRHDPLARRSRRSSSSATTVIPATARRAHAAPGAPAHIHISWASGCFGSGALSPPCAWVGVRRIAGAVRAAAYRQRPMDPTARAPQQVRSRGCRSELIERLRQRIRESQARTAARSTARWCSCTGQSGATSSPNSKRATGRRRCRPDRQDLAADTGSPRGFTRRNLFYMRRFAALWPNPERPRRPPRLAPDRSRRQPSVRQQSEDLKPGGGVIRPAVRAVTRGWPRA